MELCMTFAMVLFFIGQFSVNDMVVKQVWSAWYPEVDEGTDGYSFCWRSLKKQY